MSDRIRFGYEAETGGKVFERFENWINNCEIIRVGIFFDKCPSFNAFPLVIKCFSKLHETETREYNTVCPIIDSFCPPAASDHYRFYFLPRKCSWRIALHEILLCFAIS